MTDNDTDTDAQSKSTPRATSRRAFLQAAGAVGGVGAITALAGCSEAAADANPSGGETPRTREPGFPLTLSISGPYHFYENVYKMGKSPVSTPHIRRQNPIWYVDLDFELAGTIDDWQSTSSQPMASGYMIRLSENGGNPKPARIININESEGWMRIEDRWRVKKEDFVIDGTETEHLVFGRWKREEPEPGTEYTVYLEANQNFHEFGSFTYNDDTPRNSPVEHLLE
jgi:hypothetical protein